MDMKQINKIYYIYPELQKKDINNFHYYIIDTNNAFQPVDVDVKTFINAYMELFMLTSSPMNPKSPYSYRIVYKKYPDLFQIYNNK
jgi:hypothetical protein